MFQDARALPDNARLTADVCIIGSGPAGLTLCQELAGTDLRILLVESGGMHYDSERQSLLHGGDTTGEYFDPVGARRSQFGGTMTMWNVELTDRSMGAKFVPLDAIDFETRDWVPHSGWPFSRADLDPYYKRAEQLCGLAPDPYDGAVWEDEGNQCLHLPADEVITRVYKIGASEPFLTAARQLINSSTNNVECLVRATVIELVPAQASSRIEYLRVLTSNRKQTQILARIFILAAGGIENARLLLLSNRVFSAGIGNSRDLVGRFLMDHPLYYFCEWVPSSPALFRRLGLYDVRTLRGQCLLGRLTLSEEVLREHRLLNLSGVLYPKPKGYRSKGIEALRQMRLLARRKQFARSLTLAPRVCANSGDIFAYAWRRFRASEQRSLSFWSTLPNAEKRFGSMEPEFYLEQPPDASNRVSLSTELDDIGFPKTLVTWRVGEQTRDSADRAGTLLNKSLERAGLGRLVPIRHPRVHPTEHHHMGTTRMHNSPAAGVVDANGRVHETNNLFVAGSSVFCTGGYANPTLTIIALAVRLAEHLKKELQPLRIGHEAARPRDT